MQMIYNVLLPYKTLQHWVYYYLLPILLRRYLNLLDSHGWIDQESLISITFVDIKAR